VTVSEKQGHQFIRTHYEVPRISVTGEKGRFRRLLGAVETKVSLGEGAHAPPGASV
jgi:hypothetical protein